MLKHHFWLSMAADLRTSEGCFVVPVPARVLCNRCGTCDCKGAASQFPQHYNLLYTLGIQVQKLKYMVKLRHGSIHTAVMRIIFKCSSFRYHNAHHCVFKNTKPKHFSKMLKLIV